MPDDRNQSSKSPSEILLPMGSVFCSRYRILEYIASGGNGQVFKTEDLHRQIFVVLKVIPLYSAEKQILRFQREAQLASKLNHESIATIFDFGVEKNLAYISMEYFDGQPLDSLYSEALKFDYVLFLDVFIQIATAISHAHKRGVIHRDLKPGNILSRINADGSITVKILDFGLAKLVDYSEENELKLTDTGLIIGTPLYMSPEQARSLPITPGSDIYSIGALMYTWVAGKCPFAGETAIETIMLISNSPTPPLEKTFDGQMLPPELINLIVSMLAKTVDSRPDLDSEIIPALLELQDNLAAPSMTESDEFFHDTKRDTTKTVAIFTGTIFLILTGVFLAMPKFLPGTTPIESAPPGIKKKIEQTQPNNPYGDAIINVSANAFDDQSILNMKEPEKVISLTAKYTRLKTLKNVGRLKNLQILLISDTDIDDAALQNLTPLKLRSLDVSHTAVSDACLTYISKISTLASLNLSATAVTPKGLSKLRNLFRLEKIILTKNDFQESDFLQIAKFIAPKCVIQARTTDGQSDPLTLDAVRRLQRKFPDLQFYTENSKFLDRLRAAEAQISNESKTENDKKALRKQFQSLLREATDAYGKGSPRLRQYHIHIGDLERELSLIESATQHYQTALRMAIQLGDTSQVRVLITNILRDTDKLADHHIEAKIDKETWTVAKEVGFSKQEIVNLYGQLAQDENKKQTRKGFDAGIVYYKKVIELEQSIDSRSPTIPQFYCYVGDCYSSMRDSESALNYYLKSVNGFDQFSPQSDAQKYAHMMALEHASRIYFKNKQYKNALEYNNRCYQLTKTVKLENKMRQLILEGRLRLLKAMNRPDNEIEVLTGELRKIRSASVSRRASSTSLEPLKTP